MSTQEQAHPKVHSLELTFSWERACVKLAGEFDLTAAGALTRLLSSLEAAANLPVHLDLSAVTFLDTHGVKPLIEAARRRYSLQLAPLKIDECSHHAGWLLHLLGISWQPTLDVEAWDRFGC